MKLKFFSNVVLQVLPVECDDNDACTDGILCEEINYYSLFDAVHTHVTLLGDVSMSLMCATSLLFVNSSHAIQILDVNIPT